MRQTVFLLSVMATMILLAGGVAVAASQLDQQQTNAPASIGMDANYPMAQTFTAGVSGSLDKVSVHAYRAGTLEAGAMLVSIQTLDESGLPSGTVLGSGSAPITDFGTTSPANWVDISLTQAVPVSAGKEYALVTSTASVSQTGASFYGLGVAFNDPYSGGDAYDRNSGQWAVRTDAGVPMDFAFKTFVVPDTRAPKVGSVMPANGKTRVGRATSMTATFSEKMDATTIKSSTFKLLKVNADGRATRIKNMVVTLDPSGVNVELDPYGTSSRSLQANTRYRAVVTTETRDLAGNTLDQNPRKRGNQPKAWTFTTG